MVIKVRWTENALDSLEELFNYIGEDSPPNAVKFTLKLLDFVDTFGENPMRFPEYALLSTKNKIYRRALFKKNYLVPSESPVIDKFIHTAILKKGLWWNSISLASESPFQDSGMYEICIGRRL